jgi:type II secretory pathway pseudopilin PulG
MSSNYAFRVQRHRRAGGETLISLLIATLIMAVIGTVMMQYFATVSMQSLKLESRVDNLTAAKMVLDKLARQVRQARNIGDVYGETQLAANPTADVTPGASTNPSGTLSATTPDSQIESGSATLMAAYFPSGTDPFYGASGIANSQVTQNFPGSPWPAAPYYLSGSCLIVQVPCFDQYGFPQAVNATTMQNVEALDTYVYMIVPDTSATARMRTALGAQAANTTLYALQVAIFPAPPYITNVPTNRGTGAPQTLLTNIVGPYTKVSPESICVFQYVNNQQITGGLAQNSITNDFQSNPTGVLNAQNLCLFTGVVANLQILNWDQRNHVTIQPIRTEMYLRNNADATIMCGQAQTQSQY